MEYEFYLDLFFLWVFFLDLLALYLASLFREDAGAGPVSLAAAAAEASATASLTVFPVLPAAAGLFWRQPDPEASCAGWLFLQGRLESS